MALVRYKCICRAYQTFVLAKTEELVFDPNDPKQIQNAVGFQRRLFRLLENNSKAFAGNVDDQYFSVVKADGETIRIFDGEFQARYCRVAKLVKPERKREQYC